MGRSYPTDVLTQRQIELLSRLLPEPRGKHSSKVYSKRKLWSGILRVLRAACHWRDLDLPGYPSGVTHWRRLRFWYLYRRLRQAWHKLLNALAQDKWLDRSVVTYGNN